MNAIYRFIIICSASFLIAGCGLYVPRIGEPWEADFPGIPDPKNPTPALTASGQLEWEIKRKIYCELRDAVEAADKIKVIHTLVGQRPKEEPFLPNNWGAQISLSLQVDENTAFNPSVSQISPFVAPMTSRSYGVGGALSSTASRNDKFNPFYTLARLRDPKAPHLLCPPGADPVARDLHITPASSSFLLGDLGLKSWLVDAMFFNRLLPSSEASSPLPLPKSILPSPTTASGSVAGAATATTPSKAGSGGGGVLPDTVSIEIRFVVVSSGNFNPQWKLVTLSANTGTTPLVGVGRTRTHDLIVTIGPPGPQTDAANFSLQVGQANRAALSGLFPRDGNGL